MPSGMQPISTNTGCNPNRMQDVCLTRYATKRIIPNGMNRYDHFSLLEDVYKK